MKKALHINEIDAAVNKFIAVSPEHPFYVNFENLRGDFQEREVMRILNVEKKGGRYIFNHQINRVNKTLLFLAGMRGSGKTSELAKYAALLQATDCFFVVTCNIDEELDMDNVQYMDIVIFQLEKLLHRANEVDLSLDKSILESMSTWFQERVLEINKNLKSEGNVELEVGNDDAFSISGLLGKLIGLTGKITLGLSGSSERATTIRTNFKNRFPDFSKKFNTFIEQTNEQLRKEGKGQEILFIVDGLEKTMSTETRKEIIMKESNRIKEIKANTIFTLPIELMKEEQRIRNFAEVISFPLIKIKERNDTHIQQAWERFREFIAKRIDIQLFESPECIDTAIEYSGGSPRQLLSIIEQAGWQADTETGKITVENMKRAVEKLGNSLARYIEPDEFEMLKKIKTDLKAGNPIGFDNTIQGLLEKDILMEYNDGTYKRVNPLLEVSKLYRHNVV